MRAYHNSTQKVQKHPPKSGAKIFVFLYSRSRICIKKNVTKFVCKKKFQKMYLVLVQSLVKFEQIICYPRPCVLLLTDIMKSVYLNMTIHHYILFIKIFWNGSSSLYTRFLLTQKKQDGVGPVDNRPSTN